MKPVTLAAKHFGSKGARCTLLPDAVSNGHWAIKREYIANAPLFATVDTAQAAFPGLTVHDMPNGSFKAVSPSGTLRPWTVLPWSYENHNGTFRLLADEAGELASINAKYLAIIGFEIGSTLYGSSPRNPFIDAPTSEDAGAIFMPFRLPALPVPPAPAEKPAEDAVPA